MGLQYEIASVSCESWDMNLVDLKQNITNELNPLAQARSTSQSEALFTVVVL